MLGYLYNPRKYKPTKKIRLSHPRKFKPSKLSTLTVGYNEKIGASTCDVVTASLPELLQSSNKNTSSSQVWYKLPDMPYSSFSINHYQGRLITFSGGYWVEQPDTGKAVHMSAPLIHIYNQRTHMGLCWGNPPWIFTRLFSPYNRE